VGAESPPFKYGSGTARFFTFGAAKATLSGGGRSSGLMSFLKIGDPPAGAIKSGGNTASRGQDVVVEPIIRISRPISTGR